MNEREPVNPESKPTEMPFWAMVVGIFTNPAAVFGHIKTKPNWLLPFAIIVLVAGLFTYSTSAQQKQMQKEFINNTTMIPESMKADYLEELETQTYVEEKVYPILGVAVKSILEILLIAAVLMFLGNFVFAGELKFKDNMALYAWSGLISSLALLVKLPVVLSKDTMLVFTSLAVFADSSDMQSFSFQILNAIDVFVIWKLIVMAIGFSIMYKLSRAKGYVSMFSIYAVYVLITAGISQVFS
ncbi:MAG: hypothetical protein GF313_06165 [Caldithrix sp.]|nr:hypothetical protein [Caldithrix sp.]